MAYKHGVYTSEVATSMVAPITGTAGLQVIVGTAPVNMLKDPAAAVNVPLLVNSYKEAVEAVGYLPDFAKYTLCECISYYDLGVTTGKMAVKILTGEADISEMPIEYYQNPVKKYMASRCEALGIEIPEGYEAIAE